MAPSPPAHTSTPFAATVLKTRTMASLFSALEESFLDFREATASSKLVPPPENTSTSCQLLPRSKERWRRPEVMVQIGTVLARAWYERPCNGMEVCSPFDNAGGEVSEAVLARLTPVSEPASRNGC